MTDLQSAVADMIGPCADCGARAVVSDTDEECRAMLEADRRQRAEQPRLAAMFSRIRTLCAKCDAKRAGKDAARVERERLESFARSHYLDGKLPDTAKGRTFAIAAQSDAAAFGKVKSWCAAPARNLWVHGPAGCGKTYLSHCAANALLARGVSVAEKYAREVNEMGAWNFKGKALSEILECGALIIQDVDRAVWTDAGLEILAEVLERRRPNPILFTAAVDFDSMMDRWRHSAALHDSIWTRIRPLDMAPMGPQPAGGAPPREKRPAVAAVTFDDGDDLL